MRRIQLATLLAVAFLGLLAATGRLRFLQHEFPDRQRRLFATLCLLAILAAAIFYPAASADEGTFLDPDELWFPGLFLGHAMLAAFLLVWWRLRGNVSILRLFHSEQAHSDDVWLGMRLGAFGWVLTMLATGVVARLLSPFDLAWERQDVPPLMLWFAHQPIGRKLIIIAVAMTVEEAFFRGFLQPRLGLLLSSLLFAVSHASYGLPLMMVSVFVISLVIGWGLLRTGRLLPCIVAHGVFDAIQLLIVLPWIANQMGHEGLMGV